jgi:hypothetical protein
MGTRCRMSYRAIARAALVAASAARAGPMSRVRVRMTRSVPEHAPDVGTVGAPAGDDWDGLA